MNRKSFDDLLFDAAQMLKRADAEKYAPVIRWMMARDKTERDADKPKRKRKQILYSPRGEKIELYRDVVKKLEE